MPSEVTPATFRALPNGEPLQVHFNPPSLQYQATTQLKANAPSNRRGGGTGNQQVAQQSNAQLTMELIFDTTDTGEDVCRQTAALAVLMKPGERNVIPKVEFRWGTFSFAGYLTQFRETVDLFSSDGTALRSSVSLTMQQPNTEFRAEAAMSRPPQNAPSGGANPGSTAPGDARAATPAGRTVNNSTTPTPPSSFSGGGGAPGAGVSASAGVGASGGAGFGLAAGGGVGAFGGAALQVSGGASLDVAGSVTAGVSSAGVSASAGAFAGLRARVDGSVGASASVSASASFGAPLEASVRYEANINAATPFAPGGQALVQESVSLSTTRRVRWDGE